MFTFFFFFIQYAFNFFLNPDLFSNELQNWTREKNRSWLLCFSRNKQRCRDDEGHFNQSDWLLCREISIVVGRELCASFSRRSPPTSSWWNSNRLAGRRRGRCCVVVKLPFSPFFKSTGWCRIDLAMMVQKAAVYYRFTTSIELREMISSCHRNLLSTADDSFELFRTRTTSTSRHDRQHY